MNRLYTVLIIMLFFSLISISSATLLQNGFYSYQNFSAMHNSTTVIGYNTNASADLLILNPSQFKLFENGSSINPLYNKTVYGSHIFTLKINPGLYYIVLSTINNQINYSLAVFNAPTNNLHKEIFYNNYRYNIVLSNYSKIGVGWISNNSINIKATDYSFYNSTMQPIIHWGNYYNMNRGSNNITFNSNGPTEIYFYYNETPELVNPLTINNFSFPQPIGVVSYGLYNISGNLIPYQINTTAIYGAANISSIYGIENSPPANTSANGASLQLNTVINIVSSNGNRYTYWLQNVAEFNTSAHVYTFGDNIWNFTSKLASVNYGTLTGNGYLENYTQKDYNRTLSNVVVYADPKYIYQNEVVSYNYPLFIAPIIKVSSISGKPVVSFGYRYNDKWQYYDNVTFNINSNNAHLIVTPYYETPAYYYYDSEFVFGGEGNGANTQFSQLGANLWEYYYSNGTFIPFKSLYTFGGNTEETATNVKIVNAPIGADAIIGIPNYAADILAQGGAPNITIPTSSVTTTAPYASNNNYNSNYTTTGNSNITMPSSIHAGAFTLNENFILDLIIIILIFVIILFSINKILSKK